MICLLQMNGAGDIKPSSPNEYFDLAAKLRKELQ